VSRPKPAQKLTRGFQTMRTGFSHDVVSRLQLKFNSDLGGLAPPMSQVSHSLDKVCMGCSNSLQLQVCVKYALVYHLLSTKCVPSVPDADFADLVYTRLSLSLASWGGWWASTWPTS
jgi:hypothetical protein